MTGVRGCDLTYKCPCGARSNIPAVPDFDSNNDKIFIPDLTQDAVTTYSVAPFFRVNPQQRVPLAQRVCTLIYIPVQPLDQNSSHARV